MDESAVDRQRWLERIAERDRQRAEFVGTVSHDLKTPLNAIMGFTSVLLADRAGLQPEQVRQLRLVNDSARSLLTRINDLLAFHRLEAGKLQAKPEWFHPAEVLLQAIEARRTDAEERLAPLNLDLTAGPIRVRTDAHLVRRVVDELLGNAIRFGSPGPIRLCLQTATADQADRRRVRIEIGDAGMGLAEELAAQLQRAFDEHGAVLERSYAGLGLGLALAREAAGALGGRIELQVERGRFTRFALVLELSLNDLEAG